MGSWHAGARAGRPQVGEQLELLADRTGHVDSPLVARRVGGHARRSKNDTVGGACGGEGGVRHGRAVTPVGRHADLLQIELKIQTELLVGTTKDFQRSVDDFWPDVVAGQDGKLHDKTFWFGGSTRRDRKSTRLNSSH